MLAIFFFNFIIYFFGFVIIPAIGGVRNNLLYTLYLTLCSVYYFITPYYFYSVGRQTIWGNDEGYKGIGVNISDFYDYGLLLYGSATLIFILAYILSKFNKSHSFRQDKLYSPKLKIILLFSISYALVLFNLFISGLNPIDIIIGSENTTMLLGAPTASNYLRNFADTMIICLVMAYYFKLNKKLLILLYFSGFTLFLIMGFRYRIIMTLIGVAICFLYQNQFSFKQISKLFIGACLTLYIILFITTNRFNIVRGNLNELVFNPLKYKSNLIFEQTRGALADFNIMKHYSLYPNTQHDYGVTNLYFLVRMLPRSLFGDFKDSLYPPPAFPIISEAYSLPPQWGRITEAILHYGYLYIAGGIFGVLVGSFIIGVAIKYLSCKFYPHNFINLMMIIILCQVLFQWITRGYFPQVIDHFAYLFLGLWMFYQIGTKKFVLKTSLSK